VSTFNKMDIFVSVCLIPRDYSLMFQGNSSLMRFAGLNETKKIIRHIVVPDVASVGTISIGYVLLFGRTVYSAIATLLGLGFGSQKFDPSTLLDYWEREGRKRSKDDREKKIEGLFG